MSGKPARSADATAWLAVAAGTIGAFMATLDTSIVNTALPKIQGEIGASQTEGTWISTSYLVAEIVMIPLAGWFEKMLSLRVLLLFAVVVFTGSSIFCGLSTNLVEMIVGRVGQGFSGGAFIPTALSIVATRLPPEKQPIGTALFGVTAVMGPIAGPILGGYLAEYFSWHYCFFINVPVGIGLFALLVVGVKAEPMHLDRLRQADILGIVGLALGLGALTVVLEEGQRDNWFESELIRGLTALSCIGFVCLFAGQFIAKKPVIALKILKTPAFAGVFVMSLVVGAALYGTLYLIPQFLAEVSDYNSFQAGLYTAISGGPTMALMTVFPLALRTIGLRYLVAAGLILYGLSCLSNAHLSSDASGPEFVLGQLLRGVGMFLSLIMLNQAAATAVGKKYASDASGLFNAARNLGGSFGLAAIATLQERRGNFHHARIVESINLEQLRARMPGVSPGRLNQLVDQQSAVMTYNDMFFLYAMVLFATVPLVFFLKSEPLKRASAVRRMNGACFVRGGLALAAAGLAACTVGPDYQGPPTVAPRSIAADRFLRASTEATDTSPPPDRWWEALGDPVLNGLVDDAFAASPTLAEVAAQLRAARAQLVVSEGLFLPNGGATTSYTRVRIPTDALTEALGPSSTIDVPSRLKTNSYSGLVDATWELDLFGAVRRGVESADAGAQSVEATFHDAQVTLANQVVAAYAQLREAQNRVALVRETARFDARLLELARLRRGRGTATDADIAQQAGQGARDRSQRMQYAVDQQLDQIALLCGREAGTYDARLAAPAGGEVEQPLPPGKVPVGSPSDWLRRRPDIRAAERTIRSRNALIGQNEAAYFPSVDIVGYAARAGRTPRDLFGGPVATLLMIPSITWDFWQIPAIRGRVAGAEAERDRALADYERTVLAALQDANDALSRFANAQQTAVERSLAVDADRRAADLVRQRLARGTATEIDVLNADRAVAQDRDQSVQARSALMQSYAALQKSLGLGWGAAPPAADAPTAGR